MKDHNSNSGVDDRARADWMSVFARSSLLDIEEAWTGCNDERVIQWLRAPAFGLVMVRARSGGSGAAFNLGEMTITHCVLKLSNGCIGTGYVQGRNRRHAKHAAVLDALLQSEEGRTDLLSSVVEPLRSRLATRRYEAGRKAESTRVEFFTLVRGGNPT